MNKEVISILITTYNRSHCLDELLERLTTMFRSELQDGTTEILVFNDASTDNTIAICDQYQEKIRCLSTPHNVGLIEARRRLIDAAQGDYLISLDDDSCFIDHDALDQIRIAFRQVSTCAVLAANVAIPNLPGGLVPRAVAPFPASNFIGCGHILRATAVKEIGGYPAFLSGYGGEEAVLTLRILDAGYSILFLPNLRIYHGENWSDSRRINERASKFLNEVAVMVHVYPWPWILPGLLKKVISHTKFNAQHGCLSAMGIGIKRLIPTLVSGIRYRQPIRNHTLKKFFLLRKEFTQRRRLWQLEGQINEAWPEIETMFVN